jgi:hypothetical protein
MARRHLAELLIQRGELNEATTLVESARLDDQPAENMQLVFLRSARERRHLLGHAPEQALADFQTIWCAPEVRRAVSDRIGDVRHRRPWRRMRAPPRTQIVRAIRSAFMSRRAPTRRWPRSPYARKPRTPPIRSAAPAR